MSSDFSNTNKLNHFQKFFYNYGIYHSDPVNILIHVICVPLIIFSLGKMLEGLQMAYNLPFNPFYALFVLKGAVYIKNDFLSGITMVVYPLVEYLTQGKDMSMYGLSHMQVIVFIHVISWILQFIGHGKFEGRKPALLDNLQLIFNAPVFVHIELMNYLFGYKKEELEETRKYINYEVQRYRNSRNKKAQ